MNKRFNIFITEPLPEVEVGLRILKDIANIKPKDIYTSEVSSEEIREVDAIIAGDSKITEESLREARRLKVIGRFGAGTDSVDLKACTEKGVIVFNIPGVNAESVAEHTIGMMIAISKKFRMVDCLVRSGRWVEKPQYMGGELWGKILGIVGLGAIGRIVAGMANAFGMKVLVYDPYVSAEKAKEANVELTNLKSLLERSDYVTLHCPLAEGTRSMVSEEELKSMKRTAILTNTSRGGIVNENALYKALKEGWIAGAGVDVLENEPVTEHPLFELDNVLLTPHTAAWTVEAFRRVSITACENILKVLKGELPNNIVNPAVIKRLR